MLWPAGDAKLWIVARSDTGLSHAIYLYLEQLGCRWYFPSERWTIIPHREDLRLLKAIAASPAFRSRQFAGSGGFGGNLPLIVGCSTGLVGPYSAKGKVGQSESSARGLSAQDATRNLSFKIPLIKVDEKDPLRGSLEKGSVSVSVSQSGGQGKPTVTTERMVSGGTIRFVRDSASSERWRLDPEEVKSLWGEEKPAEQK